MEPSLAKLEHLPAAGDHSGVRRPTAVPSFFAGWQSDLDVRACLSCNSCMVRCPRGIEIPNVMDALRQIILRTNTNLIEPTKIDPETLRDAPQMAMVAAFRKLTS